jgi:hypothetical protein
VNWGEKGDSWRPVDFRTRPLSYSLKLKCCASMRKNLPAGIDPDQLMASGRCVGVFLGYELTSRVH